MAEIEHIRPDGITNSPTYTQVVTSRANRTVHVSGQVALDGDGNVVGEGDLGAQTDQTMKNLEIALAAAGATFADVVKITTFVVGYEPSMRPAISDARGKYLPADNPPASTLLGVTALADPRFLIEIEATAVTD